MTTQLANGASFTRKKVRERVPGQMSPGENSFKFMRRNDFKLLVGAIARRFVGTPSPELRHMTEAGALHMFIRDFDHQLGSERLPR